MQFSVLKRIVIFQLQVYLLVTLILAGLFGGIWILLNYFGILEPSPVPHPPTLADFKNVVGMTAPSSVTILNGGTASWSGGTMDLLSFTISKADLQQIIKQEQFNLNWNMAGLEDYPTAKMIARRRKYTVYSYSDGVGAPSWWKPAHMPDHYITYELDTEDEVNCPFRILVIVPNSNVVYAAHY